MTEKIIALFYIIPLLRLAFFWMPPFDSKVLRNFNAAIGRLEWLVGTLRDIFGLPVFLFFAARGVYEQAYILAAWYAGFALLSVFAVARFKLHARRMAKFSLISPAIDPKLFFTCYYAGFGVLPVKLPSAISTIDPRNCSFRTAKICKSLWPVIIGLFNTITLARLIVASFRWKGPEYSRKVAENIASIWGSRAVSLGKLSVRTEGLEKLSGLDGKFIFAFNHASYLDFVVAPMVLAGSYHIRFLAARDHFMDNPFLYFIMGRAMHVAGMIFVDRFKKDTSPRAAAIEAVEKLAGGGISIVIFPQGTRAYGNIGPNGQRLDSGYYTSGKKDRLIKTGGHMKKGAAFIAVDAAISLREREQSRVHIIPVGLAGTGQAVPKKAFRMRTGTEITVRIGEPITIKGSDVANLEIGTSQHKTFVEDINNLLDQRLKGLLEIHARLEQRFFKDIRSLLPPSDYEHVSVAMKAWRGKDYLIYTLLDCIYATRPNGWHKLLRELSFLLTSDAPHGTLIHFKERVIDLILEG